MPLKARRSARFAILFLLALAAVSASVFLVFSTFQRKMAAERREESRANLEAIGRAVRAYSGKNAGSFPEHASRLIPDYISKKSTLRNAAWPELPGYVYVPGAHIGAADAAFILVYENVPERKRKLGIQVLHVNETIESLSERDFIEKLTAQESAWKKSNRVWAPEAMVMDAD